MNVITRFAPSPTGYLHAGNYRTAIFAYLFARKNNGKFILRIEDTDRERSKKEYEDNIIESLAWLKLPYDAFFRQSDHMNRHKQALEEIIGKGTAYISKETPKEEGQRSEVIRFKNPNEKVTFSDVVHGPITFDTTDLGDFVIGKSVTEPLYHFGVVVDDVDEKVTHVIRGEDHISNTPRQILIQRALGAEAPIYAHLPLVLSTDRTKLSKRKGAKAITEYRDMGFLPEAILNYLSLLGWNPGTDQEIFTLPQLIEAFTLERIQKGPAVFDEEKLKWFNREHIKLLDAETFKKHVLDFMPESVGKYASLKSEVFDRLLPDLRERISTFGEIRALSEAGELGYFFETPTYEPKDLLPQGKETAEPQEIVRHLEFIIETLNGANENDFSKESVKALIFDYATKEGRGKVLWPMRLALSGKAKSPDPFTLAHIVGKTETLKRLQTAKQSLAV